MNGTRNRQQVSQILRDLAETLDVPPSKYEEAKEHYQAVGDWLGEEDSELAPFNPQIYAQGSFALGTAVRPLGEDEYDVDAVCLLDLTTDQVTQKQLKDMVGRRLKHPSSRYKHKIEPVEGGCRCWTIQYADGSKFHLDVLPCVPDDSRWFVGLGIDPAIVEHAIRLTDKKTPEYETGWPQNGNDPTRSNPKGYAMWFRDRMKVRLTEAKAALAMEKRASVEEIEDYQVRTPLQRAVQILKRHRDVRYNGDDDKPISIIITTLAAKAYDNEADLYEAIMNIVPGMRRHIEQRNGVWWIANPVNPLENFADKWEAHPRKAKLFFEWLDALEAEYQHIVTDAGFEKIGTYLAESYGQRDAKAAMTKYASRDRSGTLVQASATAISRFDVPHRQKPSWPAQFTHDVTIEGTATRNGWRTLTSTNGFRKIAKHYSLRFQAKTNVPWPYDVYWQVVNTGPEAEAANSLRGQIFSGSITRTESTLYTGFHWIECFIVKDGYLVARSGEFVVNIE